MMDLPTDKRRTFLEIHSAEREEPRLLQLEPYVKFANVFEMIGAGALYWGSRPVSAGDTPARLRMPAGVDNPVDLFFEPAAALASEADTLGEPPQDPPDNPTSDSGGDEVEQARLGSAFDPFRQPIPPVLPARFATATERKTAEDGDSEAAGESAARQTTQHRRLISPSVVRLQPPLAFGRAAGAHLWQPRAPRGRVEGHIYAEPDPLSAHPAARHPSPWIGGGSDRLTHRALQHRHPFSHAVPPSPSAANSRGNKSIVAPPADALIDVPADDSSHHGRPRRQHRQGGRDVRREGRAGDTLALEDAVDTIKRELDGLKRERAAELRLGLRQQELLSARDVRGSASPAPQLLRDQELVQTPPRRLARGRAPSIDVDELAEELHFQQMRRLMELRALRVGKVPPTLAHSS